MSDAAPPCPILDLDYLERQTFGDAELARDLLVLFDQQCVRLVPLICGTSHLRERADAAHGLAGAARAVGAIRVAALATEIEAALQQDGDPAEIAALTRSLREASDEVRAALAGRLLDPPPADLFRLAKPDRVA